MSFTKVLAVLIFVSSIFISDNIFAQQKDWQKISIGGIVTEDNAKLINATVTLYKEGVKINRVITNETGLFVFNLAPSSEYSLLISKEGYTSKKLFISTNNIPNEIDISWTSGITIDIFKVIRDLDVSILENPVGKIYYYDEKKDLDYDKEYTKSIQSALNVLEELLDARKEAIRKEALALEAEQKRLELLKKKEEEEKLEKELQNNKLLIQQKEEAKRIEKIKKDSLQRAEFAKRNLEQKNKFIQETKSKKQLEIKNKAIADSLLVIKLAKKKIEDEYAALLAFEQSEKKRKESIEKARIDSARNASINEFVKKKNEDALKQLYKKGFEAAAVSVSEDKKTKESIFPSEGIDSLVKVNVNQTTKDSIAEEIAKAKFNSKLTNEEKEQLLLEIQKKYPEGITIEEENYPSFKITRIISNQHGLISEHKMIEFKYGKFFKKNGLDITEAVFRMETKGYEKYLKEAE